MKVVVFVKATKSSEAGIMPTEQLLADMGRYNEELVKAGIMIMGEGLKPTSQAVRVRFSGANRIVTDGPFLETHELVAGFWIWQVKSMQEAIDWVKRCPNPMLEDSDIDIRPMYAPEDFGPEFTPELREQEAGQRARILGLEAPRFENAPAMTIAGLNSTYTNETRQNIPAQWKQFAHHLGRVSGQVGKDSFGVCWNFQPSCQFDYLTGVQVTDGSLLPAGFTQVPLAPARYVIFTHSGHVSKIPETIDIIWTKWLPESGFKTCEAPAFERYTEQFDPKTQIGGTEIWIPLQS